MRIINVIESKSNVIQSIESFGIFEEQLVDDVVKQAEKLFTEKAIKKGCFDEEEIINIILENGYYEDGNYMLTIIWSSID